MKYLILLTFTFLLFACSNGKKVYWCGDHACINKKERDAYFKKTMIVEIRELNKQNKKGKSELEIIKKQAGLEDKEKIKDEKELYKQVLLDEKRRIKEEKKLAKQIRLDEKRRIKEKKKSSKKKVVNTENVILKKEILTNTDTLKNSASSVEFEELVEAITKKNMFRSYPSINDIPN